MKRTILEYLQIIIIGIILSLLVRTYIAEARWIPSESMLPTLKVGDRLIVDKISYEIKGINGIKTGDIIVFNPPPSANIKKEALIKRVIGLPGETISIKNGTVYINGMPFNEPYIMEKPRQDFQPYLVPENTVFVMGDNRNDSFDSRFWGPLPIQNIIGKADFRYYPLHEIGTLDKHKDLRPD